jgi:CHRD domain-containing protein
MGARRVATIALTVLAAIAGAGALAAADGTFTAALGWVPIGGAERSDVAGEGRVTATLSGSKLSITGSFDGLPAKATAAKLQLGVAKGARGPGSGVALGELRVGGGTSGTLSGDVRLSAEQVEALKAGRVYLQIYSEKGVLPDHATLFGWLASEGSNR